MKYLLWFVPSIFLLGSVAYSQVVPEVPTNQTVPIVVDSLDWFIRGPEKALAMNLVVDKLGNVFVAGHFKDTVAYVNKKKWGAVPGKRWLCHVMSVYLCRSLILVR